MNTKNLKPFDLQAALKGEPVMLRNGSKAYVRHHETELPMEENSRLLGVAAFGAATIFRPISWTESGPFFEGSIERSEDIIGMYPNTRIINGFEVPIPEIREPQDGSVYYTPVVVNKEFYHDFEWNSLKFDLRTLERGLVFLKAEDAIANAKAMLGINPYD